jgi:hypothetical protein
MFHDNTVEVRSFVGIFEKACLSMSCTIYKQHDNCQNISCLWKRDHARVMLVRPKGWEISG